MRNHTHGGSGSDEGSQPVRRGCPSAPAAVVGHSDCEALIQYTSFEGHAGFPAVSDFRPRSNTM